MQLVKFVTEDGFVMLNPEQVVSVRKGMKDTQIQTVVAAYTVRELVDVAVRLLGAEELAVDITPALTHMKTI